MDINNLYTVEAHEEGAEIRIVSPLDGKKTDFYISVQGVDSKAYRTAVKAYHRKLLNDEEGGEIELIVAITKGWRGLVDGDKEVEFSAKNFGLLAMIKALKSVELIIYVKLPKQLVKNQKN